MSYDNIIGLALSAAAGGLSGRGLVLSGKVLGEHFAAGIAFLALLVLALVAVHVPLGDYMYRVYTSPRRLARREGHLPRHRRRPQSRTALVRLRPQRAGVLGGQRPVPVLLPVGAGQVAAAPARSGDHR